MAESSDPTRFSFRSFLGDEGRRKDGEASEKESLLPSRAQSVEALSPLGVVKTPPSASSNAAASKNMSEKAIESPKIDSLDLEDPAPSASVGRMADTHSSGGSCPSNSGKVCCTDPPTKACECHECGDEAPGFLCGGCYSDTLQRELLRDGSAARSYGARRE